MSGAAAAGATRLDLAVVLARGRARRMGRPKGLIPMVGQDETFVARICRLYAGWTDTIVVVGSGQGSDYAAALAAQPAVRILEADFGEGTARTLHLGWLDRGGSPTHIWAHPVDMPLVSRETVEALRDLSRDHPGRIIRPQFGGRPGHPVVLPAGFLEFLNDSPSLLGGAVQEVLPTADQAEAPFPLLLAESDDVGTVTDFDSPEDLPPGTGKVDSR